MSLYCTLYLEGHDGSDRTSLPLGRDWDMLNFLFTGERESSDDVKGFLVCDFDDVAPEVHMIPIRTVKAVADWLSATATPIISSRFDPKAMLQNDLYDADLAASEPHDYLPCLEAKIDDLRSFFAMAAKENQRVARAIL